MWTRSSASISAASPRIASALVERHAPRTEGGDEDEAADDGHVLLEVIELVRELRGLELPEAVRHRGRHGDEHDQQPRRPARAPAGGEHQAGAELDRDGDD